MYGARYELPTLYNWMDAAVTERDIKPIRGRTPDCKPLGKRRNTHVTIRKLPDEAIACRLYRTDVVTYHKDGRIVINLDGYATQTTLAFIEELLNVGCCLRHNHAWISATHNGTVDRAWYALNAQGENIMRRNAQGNLTFENPKQVTTHKINRAAANNVRKLYKPFKDYVVRVMRLRDDGFSAHEFGEVFGWVRAELPEYPKQLLVSGYSTTTQEETRQFLALARSEQTQDQYKASLWLARCVGHMRQERWRPSLPDMLKRLDDFILYAHRDECFVTDYAGSGDVVRDNYAKFFRQ